LGLDPRALGICIITIFLASSKRPNLREPIPAADAHLGVHALAADVDGGARRGAALQGLPLLNIVYSIIFEV
jgi:hypothetical protein